MGQLHMIEGTWDEIKRHEAEFVGHHLHVLIDARSRHEQRSAALQRLDAWNRFVSNTAVHGVVIDDSREAIYGYDAERG